MLPVFHIQDRNDWTRVQVENSVAAMVDAQAACPTAGTGDEITDIPGSIHPLVFDLTDTPDDRAEDDAAQ